MSGRPTTDAASTPAAADCPWDGSATGIFAYAYCQGHALGSTGHWAGSSAGATPGSTPQTSDDPCAGLGLLDRASCELRQVENRATIIIVSCVVGGLVLCALLAWLFVKYGPSFVPQNVTLAGVGV